MFPYFCIVTTSLNPSNEIKSFGMMLCVMCVVYHMGCFVSLDFSKDPEARVGAASVGPSHADRCACRAFGRHQSTMVP